jgi:hypothetical protein
MSIEQWWNNSDMGKLKYWETKMTCPSAILPTTNLTWSGLGLNVGLCGEIFFLISWFLDRQNCGGDKWMNFLYYFHFSATYNICPGQLN